MRLARNVVVASERVITASGGTAAADLMRHLIGAAHGEDLALKVADQMLYPANPPSRSAARWVEPQRTRAEGGWLTRWAVTRRVRRPTSWRCRDVEILKRFRSDFF
ncbi:MAG: hypothetical protein CVT70_07220 [Alphaproteobacteria bacterium HGW-Alphaproteobacteria-1]|nr:MAG: hypothetical protein CVT70_07220 [Alphaproteobacteria bacterium HGW-Alphaproteobacteria-1]